MLDYLHLPASTIANKIITKNIFELADISNSDRKILTQDVARIVWEHRIAPDNSNIRAICNDAIDYSEIQIIRIDLKKRAHITRISNLILSSFQYPLLLVFNESGESLFIAAHVRINQNDCSKLVVEKSIRTEWMSPDKIGCLFDITKMRSSNMYDLYDDIFNVIVRIRAENKIHIDRELSSDEYKIIDNTISEIDSQIATLRNMLKVEDQFNRQIELNNQIKTLQLSKQKFIQDVTNDDHTQQQSD